MKLAQRFTWTVAVLVFLFGLIANFPARLAHAWFAPENVQLVRPVGTLWSGQADQLVLQGFGIEAPEWRTAFWPMLAGRLAVALSAKPGGGLLSGNISVSRRDAVHIDSVRASVPIQAFHGLIPLVGVSGTINVSIDELSIGEGTISAVRGNVLISDLRSAAISADNLGSYLIEIQSSDAGVVASVEDREAVLDIAGSIRLSPSLEYQFVGQVAETARTPQAVRSQLAVLGGPNERGQRAFRFEGAL